MYPRDEMTDPDPSCPYCGEKHCSSNCDEYFTELDAHYAQMSDEELEARATRFHRLDEVA